MSKSLFMPFLILLAIAIIGLAVGFLLLCNPALAIEIQQRFYEKINWRIAPISLSKELRNTKLMGLFLIIISLTTQIYVWVCRYCGY